MSERLIDEREDQYFKVLRSIEQNPELTQRAMSQALNISLGALNYTIRALVDKGLVKARNFKNSRNRLSYAYLLTPKGVQEKGLLTVRFMARKMREFERLKREIEELKGEVTTQERYTESELGGIKQWR